MIENEFLENNGVIFEDNHLEVLIRLVQHTMNALIEIPGMAVVGDDDRD